MKRFQKIMATVMAAMLVLPFGGVAEENQEAPKERLFGSDALVLATSLFSLENADYAEKAITNPDTGRGAFRVIFLFALGGEQAVADDGASLDDNLKAALDKLLEDTQEFPINMKKGSAPFANNLPQMYERFISALAVIQCIRKPTDTANLYSWEGECSQIYDENLALLEERMAREENPERLNSVKAWLQLSRGYNADPEIDFPTQWHIKILFLQAAIFSLHEKIIQDLLDLDLPGNDSEGRGGAGGSTQFTLYVSGWFAALGGIQHNAVDHPYFHIAAGEIGVTAAFTDHFSLNLGAFVGGSYNNAVMPRSTIGPSGSDLTTAVYGLSFGPELKFGLFVSGLRGRMFLTGERGKGYSGELYAGVGWKYVSLTLGPMLGSFDLNTPMGSDPDLSKLFHHNLDIPFAIGGILNVTGYFWFL